MDGASEYQILRQRESVYAAELTVQENQNIVDLLQVKAPREGVIGQINVSVGIKLVQVHY